VRHWREWFADGEVDASRSTLASAQAATNRLFWVLDYGPIHASKASIARRPNEKGIVL
jgi:hypothetical protein